MGGAVSVGAGTAGSVFGGHPINHQGPAADFADGAANYVPGPGRVQHCVGRAAARVDGAAAGPGCWLCQHEELPLPRVRQLSRQEAQVRRVGRGKDVDLLAGRDAAEDDFVLFRQPSALRWQPGGKLRAAAPIRRAGNGGRTDRAGPRHSGHVRGQPVQAGQLDVPAGYNLRLLQEPPPVQAILAHGDRPVQGGGRIGINASRRQAAPATAHPAAHPAQTDDRIVRGTKKRHRLGSQLRPRRAGRSAEQTGAAGCTDQLRHHHQRARPGAGPLLRLHSEPAGQASGTARPRR
uniref:(northern house mosquito) hypothetical protein n=1 Tax=Culex pipiens TaxID=7175 RepID=A0A8D8ICJ7_CULPI